MTCTGAEPIGNDRGAWTWTITNLDSGASVVGPVQAPALTDRTETFGDVGRFRVELKVEFGGATSEDQVVVGVTDRCTIQPGGQDAIDLQRLDTGSIGVRVRSCFGDFGGLQHTLASFLSRTGSSMDVDPQTGDGTATVTVRLASVPQQEGRTANAVTFRLGNDRSVSYDVLTNRPPVIQSVICLPAESAPNALFLADIFDADKSSLTVTLRIGRQSIPTAFGGFSDPPDDYVASPEKSSLPNVSTWTVLAEDKFGRQAVAVTEERGNCW